MFGREITYQSVGRLAERLADVGKALELFAVEDVLPIDVCDRCRNLIEICDILLQRTVNTDCDIWVDEVIEFLGKVVTLIHHYESLFEV
jgi:hypothetical protein